MRSFSCISEVTVCTMSGVHNYPMLALQNTIYILLKLAVHFVRWPPNAMQQQTLMGKHAALQAVSVQIY